MNPSLWRIISTLGLRPSLRSARLELKRGFVQADPWFNSDDSCPDDAILIGGCGRSGTTLLRELLNRHSRIAVGPETAILCDIPSPGRLAGEWGLTGAAVRARLASSASVVRFAEGFFRDYATAQGKARWGDKTPRNIRALPRLLHQFPAARFIHIIRDGRDVACSLRNHPREVIRRGKVVPNTLNKPIGRCALRWVEDAGFGLAFHSHPRVLEVRYEALVLEPEAALRRVCEFLGEEFEPAMLDASSGAPDLARSRRLNNTNATESITPASLARWRRDMTPDERRDFVRVAGELLIALGYATSHDWADEPTEPTRPRG